MTGETDWAAPLVSLVVDMVRAGDLKGARMTALSITRGRLLWVRPMVLARLAATAEEVGVPAPTLWDEATMLTTAFEFPNWNVYAMERVAHVADAAGHPDKALSLADDADDLMRALPPSVLQATSLRWDTPADMRNSAFDALAQQGRFLEALTHARQTQLQSWDHKVHDLSGKALAAVARRIGPNQRDDALLSAMRKAATEITGSPLQQAEWLAEVGPALGRLGDETSETAIFALIERLADALERPADQHRAFVHLAVGLHQAGKGDRAEAFFARAAALLDTITNPQAAEFAIHDELRGFAFTGRSKAAWALSLALGMPPRERSFRQYDAFAVALAAGFEDQALWMRNQTTDPVIRDSFQKRLAHAFEEAGRLAEAREAVLEMTDPSLKAEAMAELAQAMILAKGGPLRPFWVQFAPDPFTAAQGDTFLTEWPVFRDRPLFADVY